MIFTRKQLTEKAKNRPQGYEEELLQKAEEIDRDLYYLSSENFLELSEKYRLPSRLQMFKNVLDAAKLVLKDGPERRSYEEIEKISPICANCPMLIEEQFRCGVCGCFLGGLDNGRFKFGKMYLSNWHCPKDKW